MGPQNSTANGQQTGAKPNQQNINTKKNIDDDYHGIGTQDASFANSFLRGGASNHSPETFYRNGSGSTHQQKAHAEEGGGKGTPHSTQQYDSRGYTAGLQQTQQRQQQQQHYNGSATKGASAATGAGAHQNHRQSTNKKKNSQHRHNEIINDQQPTWSQLSRQQQRIYDKWRKAHQRQLHNKRLQQAKQQSQQEKLLKNLVETAGENNTKKQEDASQEAEESKKEQQKRTVQKLQDGEQAKTEEENSAASGNQRQKLDDGVKQQEPESESIWSGLQRRLTLTLQRGSTTAMGVGKDSAAGADAGSNKNKIESESELLEDTDVGLTIQVNETETLRVPLDLSDHENLSTFTSAWLQDCIFKVVREKRLATRSASHSKSSTDVPGSEDGLSAQQKQMSNSTLEPVCLSTVYNETECIDYLLTQPNQQVSTYLPMDSVLKVNYVAKDEIEEEKNSKQVPSLRNFDFIKVLGTGGFATVYMVRKRTTGKLFAMKLVKKDGVKQDQVKFAQVYTERQILERLKNPFLVQLHYAFVTTNYYCLVIDLCTGGELFYYLQKNQSFQLANAKLLFAEVVLAVEFLHRHDILYRDLKPENVLVDERGHLRLTDFGLCRGNFVQRRDRAMSFVGSPEYMSPEILLGIGYDYSVDFYTLGVLLYEMLVGLPPHYNENKMQMYKDITMKEPVIPSVLQGDARDILERLLKIEPTNRLGMGEGGIQDIKNHDFFKEIDWEALSRKAPQPGRKRLPLEVNILESNFDRQYTRLPININVAQEELIKINDPILPTKSKRKRCKSFTWKPKTRSARHREQLRNRRQLQLRNQHQQLFGNHQKKLHRETAILLPSAQKEDDRKILMFHQKGSGPISTASMIPLNKYELGQLKHSEKTRSQHIRRQPLVPPTGASADATKHHYLQKGGTDLNSQIAAIANSLTSHSNLRERPAHTHSKSKSRSKNASRSRGRAAEQLITRQSGNGAVLKYSRACSQEVIDQLSHITATQSIILGLQNSSSQSQSNHFQQEIQDHLFRPKLKKMGTQEHNREPFLFKNSQIWGAACLDVFTELSLVTEQEEAKTMRRSERCSVQRNQSAFKNTLQQRVIEQNAFQQQQQKQSYLCQQLPKNSSQAEPQHFVDALSPFTPLPQSKLYQQQQLDVDEVGCCHYNAATSSAADNFASTLGGAKQPCINKQLLFNHHHHHGHSEYNPRTRAGMDEDDDHRQGANRIGGATGLISAGGVGPSSKGNQESAFNFRKQTLCDDEVMSREEDVECVDNEDDKDQNSCTEVDLMTNNRGGCCDINNYFSDSSKANFLGSGVNNQGATPNKLSIQFSSTAQAASDQLMLPAMERTPLDYLSQQRQAQLTTEDDQLSEQFASKNIAERGGIANYEQVLNEEVDNRFGEQYKIKALPAVKKPSQASFSAQYYNHQKTQSNSTMGMLLSQATQGPAPFPKRIVTNSNFGQQVEVDEQSEDAKLFGSSDLKQQKFIQVGRLSTEEESDHQQIKNDQYYQGNACAVESNQKSLLQKQATTSTGEDNQNAALLYVFGGSQGRAEDSMLSEEYTPQVVVQIDPSMTPDVQPTPNDNRSPKQGGSSSFQVYSRLTNNTNSSIGLAIAQPLNDQNNDVGFPSIIIEESPRNKNKDHPTTIRLTSAGAVDDSKVVIQMLVSEDEDGECCENSQSAEQGDDEYDQDRARLLEEASPQDEEEQSMLASLVIESTSMDEDCQNNGHQDEGQIAQANDEEDDDAMLAVGGSLGISCSYDDDEASIGFLNHNQIDTSKILALQKLKNKKLKKRLSQKHQLDQTATLINERSQEVDDRQQALQYQYGFSVEQQKDNSSRQGSNQKARQVIRFMHNSAVRNVSKHQSSQNISNLIAKSVIGVTPKIISKCVSRERLPNLPLSKVPQFTGAAAVASNTNSHSKQPQSSQSNTKKLKGHMMQRPPKRVGTTGATASSLQHHQLINFAEKAAGVISERNRKFSKPQTLKNLEQKLLQADDSDFDGVMDDEYLDDVDEEEMVDSVMQVEVFKLELPGNRHRYQAIERIQNAPPHEVRHNADMQLQFNSEMISIDEFESRIEEEPQRFNNNIYSHRDNLAVNYREGSSIGYTEIDQIADYIGVNVTSEAFDQVEATSPVLQFRSQTMADISSPPQQSQTTKFKGDAARKSEAPNSKPIRESMSSPIITSLKPKASGYLHNQHTQHFPHQQAATSRNTMYDSTRPQNQTGGNSKPQFYHRTSQKRLTLNGLLLNSHNGNPFSTGVANNNNNNNKTLVKKTSTKKSAGSTSPNNRKFNYNNNHSQQEHVSKKGKIAAASSMSRMSTMSNHLLNLRQHQSVANNQSQNNGTGARATTAQIKDLIPYTQRIYESNSAAAIQLTQSQQNNQTSSITTSWSKKPTPMLTGVSLASNSTATLPSNAYKKRSSKAQMAQIVSGNSTFKGPQHKRKASANKLIMDSSASLHLVGATPSTGANGNNQRYSRVGSSQLQHSFNPNNLSAMNFGGITSSQLNQHANGAPKTSQTTIAPHATNNSSNKAKQQVRSSQKLATSTISKRQSKLQHHSSHQNAQLSSGNKLSIATFSGGKMRQPPPKQPTLTTSPVTKVAPSTDQQSISLRLLQTPSGFTQGGSVIGAGSNSVSQIHAANLKLSTISTGNLIAGNQQAQSNTVGSFKEKLRNAAEQTTSAQKNNNNNRLATVSSRKSFVSQTRSGKSLKSSMLSRPAASMNSEKKMRPPQPSASKYENHHHQNHQGTTFSAGKQKKQFHAQSESTMQIDRQAYQKWNEDGPAMLPRALVDDQDSEQAAGVGGLFMRQNSEHFKDQWTFRQSNSARNTEKALQQLQQIKSGKQSIFEVVDDIMNSLQTPYGASWSPDIRGSKHRTGSKFPKLTSGQPLLNDEDEAIEDPMMPLSAGRAQHSARDGHHHSNKHFYSSQKALGPHEQSHASAKAFETQHNCDTRRAREQNNLTTPMQLNTEITQDSELRKSKQVQKEGSNFKIEPILPSGTDDGETVLRDNITGEVQQSPYQDDQIQQERTFPTLESEIDGQENTGKMSSGLTPYHALAVLKQKTPFRNKNLRGRNETSIEVLMLDGSEFVSMSDTPGVGSYQNAVMVSTEEQDQQTISKQNPRVLLSSKVSASHFDCQQQESHIKRSVQQRLPLNATFQYTVQRQSQKSSATNDQGYGQNVNDQMTGVDSMGAAPSLPESNLVPNSLTTVTAGNALILSEGGRPFSAATTERASTGRRMIATHGHVSTTSLVSIGSKQAMTTTKRSQQNNNGILEQVTRQGGDGMAQRNIKRKQSKQFGGIAAPISSEAPNTKPAQGGSFLSSILGGGGAGAIQQQATRVAFSASTTPVYKHGIGISSSQKVTGRKDTTSTANNIQPASQQQYQPQQFKRHYYQKKSKKGGRKNGATTSQKQGIGCQQMKVKRQSTFNNSMTNNTSVSIEQPPQQLTTQPRQRQSIQPAIPGANHQRPVTTTTQALSSGKRSLGGLLGSSVKHMAPGNMNMIKNAGGPQHSSCKSARGHQSRGSTVNVAQTEAASQAIQDNRSVSIGPFHQQSSKAREHHQISRKLLSPQPTLKLTGGASGAAASSNSNLMAINCGNNNIFAKKVSLDLGGGGGGSSSAIKPFRLTTSSIGGAVCGQSAASSSVSHFRNDSGSSVLKGFSMIPNFSRSLLLQQKQASQQYRSRDDNFQEDNDQE